MTWNISVVEVEGYSSNGYPKGLVITILSEDSEKNTIYEYEYSDYYKTYDEYELWFDEIKQKYSDKKYMVQKNWWKIERYECTLVGRDREWWSEIVPKILEFWEEVEYYRKEGNQELIDKKNKRKRKKKSPKNIIDINAQVTDLIKNICLLDSDSDE